jgi:Bacterial Ig-like domain (group 3)
VILVSFPNPSDFGQTVLFGVGVVPTIGNGIPTGTVTLMNGSTAIGTNPLVFGLTAFSISSLPVGSDNITAVYSGDSNYLGSTSNVVIQKVHYDTKTTLTSAANPSTSGQSVTFTATVTAAAGTPTGTVTFSDGSTVLGPGTLSGGKATYTTSGLSVGTHPITAGYAADTNDDVSTSNVVMQVVNSKNSAKVTLSSSLNPSVYGQSVTFTATISPSAATGTVQFQIDGTNFGSPANVSGGKAVSGSTTSLSIGSHNITATYSGDGTYGISTAILVQKVKSKTVCNWPSKPNPCNWGQTCIFNIQIGCQSPGTGNPTGTVTFYDGSNSLGSCSMSGSWHSIVQYR